MALAPSVALGGTGSIGVQVSPDMQDIVSHLEKSAARHPDDAGIRLALGTIYMRIAEGDIRRFEEEG